MKLVLSQLLSATMFLAPLALHAQSFTASLIGDVTDVSAALVARAFACVLDACHFCHTLKVLT
jgi:hypothetical protein